MRKRKVILILMALTIPLALVASAWAGPCAENAYGICSLRGDAEYPPGWAAGPIKISAPDENSVEDELTSSVSDPVSVSEVPTDTPVELTFDFAAQPIPAGITDLYLLVMFQGEIGDPAVTALAVGVKDLNEPLHFTPWNYRDYFFLNFQLRPAQEVADDPVAIDSIIGQPECIGLTYDCIAPKSENCSIGFTANEEDQPIYVAYYQDLAPGYHGRFIALLGEKIFISIHAENAQAIAAMTINS